MGIFKRLLISIGQVLAAIMVVIGLSIVWSDGPEVIMSMIKASNYQVKEGIRSPFNTKDILTNNPKKSNAIVRLHTLDNRFFCSGSVISDKYVLTASHCLVNSIGKMRNENLYVVAQDRMNVEIGIPVAAESTTDLALIEGDFSGFNKIKILIDPNDLDLKDHFKICGFQMGTPEITCYNTEIKSNNYFTLLGTGITFRGSSGGPGIDLEKNIVISVNTAVSESGVILSPVIGIFQLFGVLVQ